MRYTSIGSRKQSKQLYTRACASLELARFGLVVRVAKFDTKKCVFPNFSNYCGSALCGSKSRTVGSLTSKLGASDGDDVSEWKMRALDHFGPEVTPRAVEELRTLVRSELRDDHWTAATAPGGLLHREQPSGPSPLPLRSSDLDEPLESDADNAAVVCGRFITAERGNLRKAGVRLASHIRWRSEVLYSPLIRKFLPF